MIPTTTDVRAPGSLVAILYTAAGEVVEVVRLGTDRIAQTEAGMRHAVATGEGGGSVGIYDGDTGELVLVLEVERFARVSGGGGRLWPH